MAGDIERSHNKRRILRLDEQLQNAKFVAEYLNAASEDDDPHTYLVALRQVVDARGGIAAVADKFPYTNILLSLMI
jgi:DNA-binding phage protein